MIRVNNLEASFSAGRVKAVDRVSFEVEKGEFYTLLGPSGCGKTTTLRCIAGLERPKAGWIHLGGAEVVGEAKYLPPHRRGIGMVFQNYAIWPHMTVQENVAFPLRVGKERPSRSEVLKRVESALEIVGMGGFGGRMATNLSGGQQQRVALARAIVSEPSVLLLDEPLSNLDAQLRQQLRREIRVIQRHLDVPTIFVTHDQIEALSMSDRIAVMDEGRIVQEGAPDEVYNSPATPFVASFLGSMNHFRGRVGTDLSTATADLHEVELELGKVHAEVSRDIPKGSDVTVVVRSDDLVLSSNARSDNLSSTTPSFSAIVEVGLFTGAFREYYLVVGNTRIHARVSADLAFVPGEEVRVIVPAEACRVYSQESVLLSSKGGLSNS